MKILYVHGYNGSSNGNSFQLLKQLAKLTSDDIEVVSLDYNQYDCDEAHDQIMKKFREEHADILVGSSLGGFLVGVVGNIKILHLILGVVVDHKLYGVQHGNTALGAYIQLGAQGSRRRSPSIRNPPAITRDRRSAQ